MSRLIPGGAIPLFDKLDQRPTAASNETDQVLPIEGVEASVARELLRLTNSRSRVTLSDFQDAALTVLDYGIPDYSARSAQSEQDRSLISDAIARAITAFEPRLAEVSVSLVAGSFGKSIARYHISANLRIAQTVRRINFKIDTTDQLQHSHALETV